VGSLSRYNASFLHMQLNSCTDIQDFVVLTMVPPEPHKAPFREIRLAVPIRLTTDPWVNEDAPGYAPSSFSVPSDPEDYVEALPQLSRGF
jgi:hypothetical protein